MEIIVWIIIGALAGWIASIIMGTNEQQGAIMNILVGIAGAVIGSLILRTLGQSDGDGSFLGSLLVATLGAVVLLAIFKVFRRRRV